MVTTMGLTFLLLAAPPAAEFNRMLSSADSLVRARARYVATRSADLAHEESEILTEYRKAAPGEKAAILQGLGFRYYPDGAPAWVRKLTLEALSHDSEVVEEAAADVIAAQRWDEARQPLAKAISRQTDRVGGDRLRRALLRAAARMGGSQMQDAVEELYRSTAGGTLRSFPLRAQPAEVFLASAADLHMEVARDFVDDNYSLIEAGSDATVTTDISKTLTDTGRVRLQIAGDPKMRVWTARAAAVTVSDPEASFTYIKDTLFSPVASNRLEAAWALASMPETSHRARALTLLATAGEDNYARVRAVVIRTLGTDGGFASALLRGLDDPYPDLRAESALGIAESGEASKYRKELSAALSIEKDPLVITALVSALERSR